MNIQIKTAFYWLLLGIFFLLHTVLHMYGLCYGVDIRMAGSTGEVPFGIQGFNTVIFNITFLMALLSVNLSGKGFRWFSLVWSFLLLLLNIFHLGATIFMEALDISQISLLTLVLAVNVLLTVSLWNSLKKSSAK